MTEINKEELKNIFKKRLYIFVLQLIQFIDELPKERVCFIIGDQLIRSGTSILSNYIEGQSASSKKEFIVFIQYCLKSANESKVWICILRDSKRIKKENTIWLLNELDEYSKIFASTILTIKKERIVVK